MVGMMGWGQLVSQLSTHVLLLLLHILLLLLLLYCQQQNCQSHPYINKLTFFHESLLYVLTQCQQNVVLFIYLDGNIAFYIIRKHLLTLLEELYYMYIILSIIPLHVGGRFYALLYLSICKPNTYVATLCHALLCQIYQLVLSCVNYIYHLFYTLHIYIYLSNFILHVVCVILLIAYFYTTYLCSILFYMS